MTDNIKTIKNQRSDAIENDPKFDNTFNLYSGTEDPLPVVTGSLWWGKKQIATTAYGLTCLWDSEATNSMMKIRHTKYYELKMHYNKLEYGTTT